MTSESPFDPDYEPPPSLRGFEEAPTDADVGNIRAAHLLIMATRLLGTTEQVRQVQEDSRALGVPIVRRPGRIGADPNAVDAFAADADALSQEQIDEVTEHAVSVLGDRWDSETSASAEVESALWREVKRSRSRAAALSLLNVDMRSANESQAVAAAASVFNATEGTSVLARSVLENLIESFDEDVARIALGALQQRLRDPESDGPSTGGDGGDPMYRASVCIHGTWARHSFAPWYASGSDLHKHIRQNCTPDLFNGREHFRWTGGYSEEERREAAEDFVPWKASQSIAEVDTVFAHSHGGNVALNRIANGEQVKLLVLLHTPVTRRPDDEWRRIAANVGRVLVMRSRADKVMLADQLASGNSMQPPKHLLPHRLVKGHWIYRESWFRHDYYLQRDVWERFGIDSDIRFERGLVL